MSEHPLNNRRISSSAVPEAMPADDALVTDVRAGLSPAQMVDRKLASLLQGMPMPANPLDSPDQRRALS